MGLSDLNKPELIKLADDAGLDTEGTKADLIARLKAIEPAEAPAEEAPAPRKKAVPPQRLSVNTWWCGECNAANAVGRDTDQVCYNCGRPVLLGEDEAE